VRPKINQYPMSKIGEALQAAVEGKARYRIVLQQDKAQ
jgi:D-arabinose 1-dehydrogenase-like Zn-dependent alcohol dehydrogenase